MNRFGPKELLTNRERVILELAGIERSKKLQEIRSEVGKCEECSEVEELQCHHIVHLEDGGHDDRDNIQVLCPECHIKKHPPPPAKTPQQRAVDRRNNRNNPPNYIGELVCCE